MNPHGIATTTYTEADFADFNRGTDRARRADPTYLNADDHPLVSVCRCGRRFASPQGLGAHRRFTPACKEVGK